jgi:hypothetical protein
MKTTACFVASIFVILDGQTLLWSDQVREISIGEIPAVWAWFVASEQDNPVRFLYVSSRGTTMKGYAPDEEPSSQKTGEIRGTLGSDEAKKHLRDWMFRREEWFPLSGKISPLSECVVDAASGRVKTRGLSAMLPGLHPFDGEEYVHLGAGSRLLKGDLPDYGHWEGSRLLELEEDRYLLIAPDTQAYLVRKPPGDLGLVDPYRSIALPLRLGKNPFYLTEERPELSSVLRAGDEIVVCSMAGHCSRLIDLGGEPRWEDRLEDIPVQYAEALLFAFHGTTGLLLKKDASAEIGILKTTDLTQWQEIGTVDVGTDVNPICASERTIVLQRRSGQGFAVSVLRKTPDLEWKSIYSSSVADGIIVDAQLDTEQERVLLLVGRPGERGGGLTLTLHIIRYGEG